MFGSVLHELLIREGKEVQLVEWDYMTDIPAPCDQVRVTPTCPSPGITMNYRKIKNEVPGE